MKILFISHVNLDDNLYGAAKSLAYLIDGLQKRGVEISVIAPGGRSHKIKPIEKLEYWSVPFRLWASDERGILKRALSTCSHLFFTPMVAAYANQWGADIIYTNSIMTPVGAFASCLIGKPHVLHIREFGWEDYRLRFDLGEKISAKLLGRMSDRVIIISKALEQKYSQYIDPQKIEVIYNPVELSSGKNKNKSGVINTNFPKNIPVLAIVGRIHPSKGQKDAVLAMAELVQRDIKARLVIVGGGEDKYLEQLKDLVIRHNLQQSVIFTGYVDNPIAIMKAADIYLVCSRCEAFGRVTAEAMMTGTPVIGSRTGATPELIRESLEGLHYEFGNHIDLADKIEYMIKHPEKAKRMGEYGFERASSKFTLDQYVSKIYDILKIFQTDNFSIE